jgi:glycine oxidase
MLAPVAEARWGDERLLPLALASARLWPEYARMLAEEAGVGLDFRSGGIVLAALDADDRAVLADLLELHERIGLPANALGRSEVRELEPALSPGVGAGVLAHGDMAVDPRRVAAALRACLAHRGVDTLHARVEAVDVTGDSVRGVVLEGGDRLAADAVVVCAGAWTCGVAGIPKEVLPPVRPVKGQVLRLRGEPLLERPVHGFVHGNPVYLVPRSDGGLVVGATQEEMGFDPRPTGRGVHDLLRDAIDLVPDVAELELTEVSVGFRPGTPDNLPIIGESPVRGLWFATGHHRNGILLAPVTTSIVCDAVTTSAIPPEFLPYTPTWPVRRAPMVVPT